MGSTRSMGLGRDHNMTKKLFKKKPVTVEAVKFEYTSECVEYLRVWMGNSFGNVTKQRHPLAKAELHVKTLEDGNNGQVAHIATEGDYIIRGISGEFYPCKPDIFSATYDEVTE